MDTNTLKKFAQAARRQLIAAVDTRLEQVLRTDSAEIREMGTIVNKLQQAIKEHSRQQVVETAAYTWFNRFCALRFMDLNHSTPVGVVSPVEGFTQPEILQEAKKGLVDAEFNKVDKQRVFGLLNGQIPSANPQQEAFRWLLVGACNSYYERMPFLFPEIDDYTALLMPSDLLSDESILSDIRETLTADTCKDVEVIGWLYQFYISEKKDQVMARKSAVPKEDIPAVTQLFTPHWIVRYLVENSLGRLWMLNHPDSRLADQMEYFIKPDQQETEFIRINSPEEIKICDPACGSGHMLTYAFDLLAAIYEEQGFDPVQIPSLIIKKNLFGIEIDERAGQLAAFALTMKAREKDKRFFSRNINPNICVMEDVSFSEGEIKTYMDKLGRDLFTQELWFGLRQFEDAKTYGSLIRPQIHNPGEVLQRMKEKGAFEDLFLFETNRKVKKVLEMVEFLNPHYHLVVTNPPYMGGKNMNKRLKSMGEEIYPKSKSDAFAMFIEQCINLCIRNGFVALITRNIWMFLSRYEQFRIWLLKNITILNMANLGANAFDTIGGEIVSTTMFILKNQNKIDFNGKYYDLHKGNSEQEKIRIFKDSILNPVKDNNYVISISDLLKVPGYSLLYWASKKCLNIFQDFSPLSEYIETREGLTTGDNELFLRQWFEPSKHRIHFRANKCDDTKNHTYSWYPYNKGGGFRRWSGNFEYVVNWENDGEYLKSFIDKETGRVRSHNYNGDYAFQSGFTWSSVSSGDLSVRFIPGHFMFDAAGPMGFVKNNKKILLFICLYLNSIVAKNFSSLLSPTMRFMVGQILKIPIVSFEKFSNGFDKFNKLIDISKFDWDSYETSWDFTELSLIQQAHQPILLKTAYQNLNLIWHQNIREMQRLEEENNRIFIEAYGLQDELTPEVPVEEITLTCNPRYRYGGKKSEVELEALLLADTMKEFTSYAVGCTFGRYSLDKPGLILANQGETLQDYLNQVPQPRFMPEKDNVLPILEGEWFADDIVSRFREFLKVTFGEEHFEENLTFLENAIGKDIRTYFLRDFYNEHVKMYKKRPIYWLFSSPKSSFNALIYMHRYQPDTVSIVLNEYLIPYREKLTARKSHLQVLSQNGNANSAEKNKAIKEVNTINAVLLELKEYEDEILYPLARERIAIDLDDGVKVNYAKFGKALKYVAGLSD